jgi:SAM-dependent methyltransferase
MLLKSLDGTCCVCGGHAFGPGPAGRMSATGVPPCCTKCGALERHRSLRQLLETFPAAAFSWRRALQFSPDVAVRPEWFRSFEVSVYGGPTSLDLQAIDRPDASYDFITLNHVLEFVPDARGSFRELMRVMSPRGILAVGFSNLDSRDNTSDHEVPQGMHGYYHLFGQDIGTYLSLDALGVYYVGLSQIDRVTGTRETTHFFCRDRDDIEVLVALVQQVRAISGSTQ